VRTRFRSTNLDGTTFKFTENNVVLLKKRLTTKGKELVGPVVRSIKRKKFVNSFAGAI
jgi:ribosomal protein L14